VAPPQAPTPTLQAGGVEPPGRFARRLFAGLPPRYDRLCEVLSMGQNRRWRRAMVDAVLAGLGSPAAPAGAPLVLDVASGTAGVALQLARRGGASVVGVDLSPEMLATGAGNLAAAGATGRRVDLVAGRAEQLPFADAAFDALTFTYLLRYVADVEGTLAELARVLKPGAPLASLDFAVPRPGFWRRAWWVYTRLVLPPAAWVTGGRAWWRVGCFLGPNISAFYRRHPPADIVAAWRAAGFVEVHARTMSLGGGLVMWGRRAGG
jgi:demethylmenaquinone methyltransferase/2-methoxy-6-polyprenyl-1,4-benzoquinol methylase